MFSARGRMNVIYIVFFVMFACLLGRLFHMQIIKGSEYKEISGSKVGVSLIEKAPRGEILDRYGRVLVGNKPSYSLSLIKTEISDDAFNGMILKLLNLLESEAIDFEDTLPIDPVRLDFTFEDDEQKEKWFEKYGYEKLIDEDMTGEEVLYVMADEIYNISGYSQRDTRRIAGARYEAEINGFSMASPFVLSEDVPVSVVARIKESSDEFPCAVITNNYSRQYFNEDIASHIIGRVGKMNEEEYEKYKTSGYKFNDIIGKQGVEKAAEMFLRGTDGTRGIESGNSTVIKKTEAVPGNNVILTIDTDMQRVLEDSLEKMIKKISSEGGEKTGGDADSGAAVVVDVRNGDILACASYPTYNLSTFAQDYSVLSEDTSLPMWNRAVSGTYSPGSTFKPLVAIAALQTGKIRPDEKIKDEGVYKVYEDYRPRCWIWSENHTTHGSINVSSAIEKSCNYFFYETGHRTGIDIISDFGAKFGLGEYTGTGLPEEVKGYIANPENKKKVFSDVNQQGWYAADTLQASIGQSVNSFTPVQIANYIAAIANGGTRYKLNVIKSVRSSDGTVVKETEPEIEAKIEISQQNLDAVRYGMKNVVEEGSARGIFTGYPIEIGGKTGTAQVGSRVSNNALFAAYAPFNQPEIAVCVVIEHGVRGANAAYVAKDLFDYYFNLNAESVSAFDIANNLD